MKIQSALLVLYRHGVSVGKHCAHVLRAGGALSLCGKDTQCNTLALRRAELQLRTYTQSSQIPEPFSTNSLFEVETKVNHKRLCQLRQCAAN